MNNTDNKSTQYILHDKFKYIALELAHHMPYSIFGVITAMLIMGMLTFIARVAGSEALLPQAAEDLFHLFHPAHILFSAVATTAMFFKHDDNKIMKAVFVGFLGSVTICGLSDIIFPFFGGKLLGYSMNIHICLIEEPGLVLPFAVIGVIAGLLVTRTFDKSTEYSHSMHVFLSSSASLLFLLGFGVTDWMHQIGGIFMTTVVAVMFPCCFSDIVFPLACTHRYCKHSKEEILHKH